MHFFETNSSHKLIKELARLGREGIPIRGVMTVRGALDRSSLRALNCYLEHSGIRVPMNRLGWRDIQEACALRWFR